VLLFLLLFPAVAAALVGCGTSDVAGGPEIAGQERRGESAMEVLVNGRDDSAGGVVTERCENLRHECASRRRRRCHTVVCEYTTHIHTHAHRIIKAPETNTNKELHEEEQNVLFFTASVRKM
jgi:hypothetical protein